MREAGKIYITGYAGSRGAALLASVHREELEQRFRPDYLERNLALLAEDVNAFGGSDAPGLLPQGILPAFYELAAMTAQGLSVRLRSIPIRQFTVELCELLGENPYLLASDCVLTVGEQQKNGVCIGLQTPDKDVHFVR